MKFLPILIAVFTIGLGANGALAQESQSSLYVPLIGITSVPQPLALPAGEGDVTYNYAVKNFLEEVALTDIQVVDDKCSEVKFTEGDDNHDSKLDYSETWRYACTTRLSVTTQSIATATGRLNEITAMHKAYATVVVGSDNPYPLVSIVNITKVSYPLSLPAEGGKITFTYRVNNPGVVPLSNVVVRDDKCSAMSGKLGDTNVNNLLDINEVWVYTCIATLTQTTTNTVHVSAFANGLEAVGEATLTVKVAGPIAEAIPSFPADTSPNFPETGTNSDLKVFVWEILCGILAVLTIFFILTRPGKKGRGHHNPKFLLALIIVFFTGVVAAGLAYFLFLSPSSQSKPVAVVPDNLFGWKYPADKFPVPKFPTTGEGDNQIAYSDIRDPGGIPQGLPVRLKIPVIGVDSAIEDAFITPDGRMDVPVGSVNVAWFALGPKPGQAGSAVIGGHFGITNGVPFVFYNLDKLVPGDKVYVVNDKGETLAFVVRVISLFDRNADATPVFISDDGLAHLNIITCEGIWNQVNDTYPQRRVVFTDAIPLDSVSVEPVPAQPLPVFTRSLSVGARGADVVELQSILTQKGLLTLPAGYVMGYFGTLTRDAIAKYQMSVGLPAFGLFGPLTRARLLTDLASDRPKLPVTAIETTPAPVSPSTTEKSYPLNQILLRAVRNFYSNFTDAVITFLLIAAICFLAFKIIKRKP